MSNIRSIAFLSAQSGPNMELLKRFARFMKPNTKGPQSDVVYLASLSSCVRSCISGNVCLSYMLDGKVAGLALIAKPLNTSNSRLVQLAVNPAYRGKGIGGELVRHAVANHGVIEAAIQDQGLADWYAKNGLPHCGPISTNGGISPATGEPEWCVSAVPKDELRAMPGYEMFGHQPFMTAAATNETAIPIMGKKRVAKAYAKIHGVTVAEGRAMAAINLANCEQHRLEHNQAAAERNAYRSSIQLRPAGVAA